MVDKEKDLLPLTALSDTENVEQSVEESIVELINKQRKAKAKSAFTRVRHHLLVHIQDEEVDVDSIKEMCDTLDDSEQETMDIMLRLSDRHKDKKDNQANYKLSQEIE